ncbi:MAG: hypothetical protein ACI8RZ_005541 [Myxococcota bacterium]|jgi:hypothetical protein
MLPLLLIASSAAEPLRLCTDRGGLLGERGADGEITAILDGWIQVSGTTDLLTLHGRHANWGVPWTVKLWEGPLADLSPTPAPTVSGLAADLTVNGILAGCPHSGPAAHFVGEWPEALPLPDGGRVTWASAAQSLIRAATGPGWMATLPMSEPQAAGLAAELAVAHPTLHTAVAWRDDLALIQVSRDPALLIGGVEPAPHPTAFLPLIAVSPTVLRDAPLPESDSLPILDAGREQAAWLNVLRADAGLTALTWDDNLAASALSHCAHIDWQRNQDGRFYGHDQRPGGPFFTTEQASERHNAWEVIHRDRDSPPHGAVDTWIATPFHRIAPMHPQAARVGACHSPDGTLVMLIDTERMEAPAVVTYPTSGMTDVPLSFSGLENPDPIPVANHPDKTLPVGFTVTAWLSDLPGVPRLVSSKMTVNGQEVAHYPVLWAEHYRNGEGEVHLIPAHPTPPGAEVRWQVKLRVARQRVVIRGDYTTTDRPAADPIALAPRAEAVLSEINTARAEQGVDPLSVTVLSQGIAALYTATRRWPKLVDHTSASATCPSSLRITEDMLSPEIDLLGVAESGSRLCLVLTGDLLTPR